jgi:hypothetical protein
MKRQTKSLLEELQALSKTSDTKHIIENRAANIIASAIHLMEVIERNFTSEQAAILEKKLLIAIKSRDQGKFSRSLKRTGHSDEDK